jgi:iron-sulfur cluster assembly accessory protein
MLTAIIIGRAAGRKIVRRFSSTELPDVIVTTACAKRINAMKDGAELRLRLEVEGGGCSGFQYHFNIEKDDAELDPSDMVFRRDGAEVVIDEASLEYVRGSTIDYTTSMIRSSFVVANNPLSESACGCGSSFALKNFASNPAKD